MAVTSPPNSESVRLIRLELANVILLKLLYGDGPDWRSILQAGQDVISSPHHLRPEQRASIERYLSESLRSQLSSPLSALEKQIPVLAMTGLLKHEVTQLKNATNSLHIEHARLLEKAQSLEVDAHSLLAIQALGLPHEQIRSTRFIPVRAYIDQTPTGAIASITSAIDEVLEAYGFSVADEFPEIRGSWFKKWFAKSQDALSQPEVIERLEKIERAIELKAIAKPQADVDEKQANAIAKLIKSLDKVPNAALQAGSVLVVKMTTSQGPVVQARTLSQEEMIHLENNQLLLQNPAEVLGKLSAACAVVKKQRGSEKLIALRASEGQLAEPTYKPNAPKKERGKTPKSP